MAVWRLRPTCLAVGVTRAKNRRRGRAPVLGERPMLWKELYIERVASLGRFGRWLGVLITLTIGGGSLVLAGMMAYSAYSATGSDLASWASGILKAVLGGFAGTLLGWLLQMGVGLRASVSIASERERAHLGRPLDEPARAERNRGRQAHRQPLCPALDGRRHAAGLDPGRGGRSRERGIVRHWIVGTFMMCASWPQLACDVRFHCRQPPAP